VSPPNWDKQPPDRKCSFPCAGGSRRAGSANCSLARKAAAHPINLRPSVSGHGFSLTDSWGDDFRETGSGKRKPRVAGLSWAGQDSNLRSSDYELRHRRRAPFRLGRISCLKIPSLRLGSGSSGDISGDGLAPARVLPGDHPALPHSCFHAKGAVAVRDRGAGRSRTLLSSPLIRTHGAGWGIAWTVDQWVLAALLAARSLLNCAHPVGA
jgi:hypothetical protein